MVQDSGDKLEKVLNKGKKDASFVELANKFGLEIIYMDRKEFTKNWQTKWYPEMGKIIRELGIQER